MKISDDELERLIVRYRRLDETGRLSMVREIALDRGLSRHYVREMLTLGRDGLRRKYREKKRKYRAADRANRDAETVNASSRRSWSDGSRRAGDDEIMRANKKPDGCSDARWRIELRRRELRAAGVMCSYDPDETYATSGF